MVSGRTRCAPLSEAALRVTPEVEVDPAALALPRDSARA